MNEFIASSMRPNMEYAMHQWIIHTDKYKSSVLGELSMCRQNHTRTFKEHYSVTSRDEIQVNRKIYLRDSKAIAGFVHSMNIESWDLYDIFFPALGSTARSVGQPGCCAHRSRQNVAPKPCT